MKHTRNINHTEEAFVLKNLVIAVKGGGEMASGVACRLFSSNFTRIFMMETENPLAVRRKVSFCEAIYDGSAQVEGVTAVSVQSHSDIAGVWDRQDIPILVDPGWQAIKALNPHVVIDAVIAKKNLGTTLSDAPLVIGLGPGFEAGKDVHMVIETNRGHNLGRIILKGCPEPNTGIPGPIAGYTRERVLRSPCKGMFTSELSIGSLVRKGDIVARVDKDPVIAEIDGVIRGLIRPDTRVTANLKIGDIDPRGKKEYCSSISEKARTIGGSVLEAILRHYNQ